MTRLGSAGAGLVALLLTVVSAPACTAIASLTDHGEVANRCVTDVDCQSVDGGAGNFCDLNTHSCARIGTYCATNQECIDRTHDNTWICQKGATPQQNQCVPLLSPECTQLLADPGDTAKEDVEVWGLIYNASWGPIQHASLYSMDLARKDFAQLGGLPALPGKAQGSRPFVIVNCDIPKTNQAVYKTATDHLNKLGVKVIFGPTDEAMFTYVVQQGATNNNVVFDPNSPSNNFFGNIPGRFITDSNPAGCATGPDARVLIVKQWEALFRAAGITRPLKVAMATSGLAADVAQAGCIHDNLNFNGKNAADNQSDGNYLEADYGDTSAGASSPSLAAALAQLIPYNPDIVVIQGGATPLIIGGLENAPTGAIHPVYVLPAIGAQAAFAQILDKIDQANNNAPLGPLNLASIQRALGERTGRPYSDPTIAAFFARMAADTDDNGQFQLAPLTYDLVYFAAYGYAALDHEPVNGAEVGMAVINRFKPGGTPASTQPGSILPTFQALKQGQNVDMNGIESPANFRADGGLLKYLQSVYAYAPPNGQPTQQRIADTGLTWSSDDPTHLVGTLNNICGYKDQPCCGGNTCRTGLTCSSSTTTCGP